MDGCAFLEQVEVQLGGRVAEEEEGFVQDGAACEAVCIFVGDDQGCFVGLGAAWLGVWG